MIRWRKPSTLSCTARRFISAAKGETVGFLADGTSRLSLPGCRKSRQTAAQGAWRSHSSSRANLCDVPHAPVSGAGPGASCPVSAPCPVSGARRLAAGYFPALSFGGFRKPVLERLLSSVCPVSGKLRIRRRCAGPVGKTVPRPASAALHPCRRAGPERPGQPAQSRSGSHRRPTGAVPPRSPQAR